MAKKICKVCGCRYSYCPTCYDDRLKPSWFSMFDSESCHDVWTILSAYTVGKFDKDEAKELLEGCDLSKINSFDSEIKATISEIMKSAESKK